MPKSIFKEGKKYTFSDYFEMNHPTEEIVQAFGYSLALEDIRFPRAQIVETQRLAQLREAYYAILPKITLNSEIAIGEVWRFASLERAQKRVVKSIHTLRFPEDVEEIAGILGGILRLR